MLMIVTALVGAVVCPILFAFWSDAKPSRWRYRPIPLRTPKERALIQEHNELIGACIVLVLFLLMLSWLAS